MALLLLKIKKDLVILHHNAIELLNLTVQALIQITGLH